MDTYKRIKHDIESKDSLIKPKETSDSIVREIFKSKGLQFVDFNMWKKVDKIEKELGAAKRRPREKITSKQEML